MIVPRRGPLALAIFREGEGWPMGNLHRDGCKHDVTMQDAERVELGKVAARCAKCDALIVPAALVRDALAEHDLAWGGVA